MSCTAKGASALVLCLLLGACSSSGGHAQQIEAPNVSPGDRSASPWSVVASGTTSGTHWTASVNTIDSKQSCYSVAVTPSRPRNEEFVLYDVTTLGRPNSCHDNAELFSIIRVVPLRGSSNSSLMFATARSDVAEVTLRYAGRPSFVVRPRQAFIAALPADRISKVEVTMRDGGRVNCQVTYFTPNAVHVSCPPDPGSGPTPDPAHG